MYYQSSQNIRSRKVLIKTLIKDSPKELGLINSPPYFNAVVHTVKKRSNWVFSNKYTSE